MFDSLRQALQGTWFFLSHLFDPTGWPRRWDCGTWTDAHGWLHVVSDLGVWSAYVAIPCVLAYFTVRRRDLPFQKVFWLFGAFILACGTTHLMEAIIFWHPVYRLAGVVKLFTALVSWGTVIALVPIVPQALALRSPRELERLVKERTVQLARLNETLQCEIGERKQVELELQEGDRRKDEFLAMLAHELRNPLAPISNAVELIQGGTDQETASWASDIMARQVRHMVRLVDDLLDVSRIMRGKIELRKERVELSSVVRHAVETARHLIEANQHQLTIDLPAEPVWLYADPIRLAQIMSNMLNNAAKYTPTAGRISLAAKCEDGHVLVKIKDNGSGISADFLPRVFDLFMQGDRSIERSQGGLGIGLTVVRLLTEMHGGKVTVHSRGPGQGTEFVVRLPILVEGDGEMPISPSPEALPTAACRVLIVDDNVDLAQTLARLATSWRHEVRVAHDGHAAIEVAQAFRPHVVLLDIGLPQMNGYEVARHLRKLPELAGTQLVAMTGYGQSEDRRRTEEAGFDRHLVKPVPADVLEALLGTVNAAKDL